MRKGFRVIDKQTGEKVFGHFLVNESGILLGVHEREDYLFDPPNKEDLAVQYSTGLLDVEGKEIFEGDVVCWAEQNGHLSKAKVVFSPTVSAFVLDVNGRHLIDSKYGDYQHMHKQINYKITEK